MLHKDLTSKIINCAYQVQKTLGFGFLESVYQNALLHELTKAGLKAQKEQKILVTYDNQIVGTFTADMVVENRIILELKSIKELHPAHEAQLNNYLKATGKQLGLLINFGHKIEIKRKINTLPR